LFFCVRHGQTVNNTLNVYRGWSNGPDSQLDAAGRDQVREAGIYLKGTGVTFPLIISDDLARSVETREILADILGIKAQETDKRLRPLNVGDYTGQKKDEYPLDRFMNNPSERIPGGESLNQFNARQSKFFADVLQTVEKTHKPILLCSHGSNVCYLHNHGNPQQRKSEGPIGYEGLVNPGGVLVFCTEGVVPLTKKREGAPVPMQDGTRTSGFVTDEESKIPRSCWNCKWFGRDINNLGGCSNLIVRLDPQLAEKRQTDGTVSVGDNDCCNLFSNHIST
jgi:broad specificity phosphatase PhoE